MDSFAFLLIAAITGAVFGFGLDQVFLLHLGHDQSWCVYAADLVMHGVQLNGPNLVEVNPPFIVWFSCIPVLLGNMLHIGILNGFRVFFDGLAVTSLVWTTLLIRRLLRPAAIPLGLFALAQSIVSMWLIRQDSLGEREHLLVLLILPYLVLAAARLEDRSTGTIHAVLIGMAASIAICLKPQHILIVIGVEVLILFRVRRMRTAWHPAMISFGCGIALYLLSVAAFGETYIENVLPKLRLAYWGLNHPYSQLFSHHAEVFVALPLCWVVFLVCRSHLRFEPLIAVLGTAALASTLAYIQQHKGWRYHLIPAGLFTVLFISALSIGVLEHWLESREFVPRTSGRQLWHAVALSIVCALLCAGLGWQFGYHADYFEVKKRQLAELYSSYPAGTAVACIATQPWTMPVVMEQHKVLGQRINYFWLLPAIFLGQDPARDQLHQHITPSEIADLSLYQRTSMAEDLAHWKPAVVVVDQCDPELCDALRREHYDSILQWFSLNPQFAREWSHYRAAGMNGDMETFRRTD